MFWGLDIVETCVKLFAVTLERRIGPVSAVEVCSVFVQ